MSADNGVYILETNVPVRGQTEFRVAHAQAIENIEWEPDYPTPDNSRLNRENVLRIFGDAPVFTDIGSALACAKKIFRETTSGGRTVEYGICFLDHSNVYFPSRKKRRTPRRRKQLALAA